MPVHKTIDKFLINNDKSGPEKRGAVAISGK